MKPRIVRAVGLMGGLALTGGLLAAAPAGAATTGEPGPQFVRIGGVATGGGTAPAVSARAAATGAATALPRVRKSAGEQILQVFKGLQGVGETGLAVAAGPRHVVQVGASADGVIGGARVYLKATGRVTSRTLVTLNQLFGVAGSVRLTEPTVAYDPIGKRWLLAAVAEDGGDVSVALRVSKGRKPTRWFPAVRYGTADTDTATDADAVESQPELGVSSDKVAITAVADDPTDPTHTNRIIILPKTGAGGLYADGEADAWSAMVNSTYDGQRPAVNASKQANLFIAVPDTNDVTVTTYTGAAKTAPPAFSKNVTYPTTALTPAPTVVQGGGDQLDAGPLAFTGVAWRKGRLWAAATVGCSGHACVRVFGIDTANGVALLADETLTPPADTDWFAPSVALDRAGTVHLVAQDVGTAAGPSLAVFARKSAGTWTAARLVKAGTAVVDPTGAGVEDWADSTGAAWDPTSPWDVWVTGVAGDSRVPNGLTSRVARVSLARNVATLTASRRSVPAGGRVAFTVTLHRPDSRDVVKGLPVALQTRPAGGGSWRTLVSGRTSAQGTATWTRRVVTAAQFRAVGKPVAQRGTPAAGRAVDRVVSRAVLVRLR